MHYIITCSIFIYVTGLLWFILGIIKAIKNPYIIDKKTEYPNISIILCVKNGEDSLNNILNDLKRQHYLSKIEFLIVDDNSNDKSKSIINEYIDKDSRFKYIHSSKGSSKLKYKKRALDAGIKESKYDILLFTDVDCRLNSNWASSIALNFSSNIDYIIGYSKVKYDKKFVSRFQKLDFMMLMFAALGSTLMGTPIASTGQNQAYKRKIFFEVNGFNKISKIMQGDDSIFLNICKKDTNANIAFSRSRNSYVESKAHVKWKDFLFQRARWAGDANIMWKYNKTFYIYILSTFTTNLVLLMSPLIYPFYPKLIVIVVALKFLFEFLLYLFGINEFNEKIDIILFFRWFFIQPAYIFIMGVFSFYQNHLKWRE